MRAAGSRWLLCLTLCFIATGCTNPEPAAPVDPPPEPSLDTAVWEGTWEFNYTLVRLVGATEEETDFRPGQAIRRIWQVTAGCEDRPCNSQISATNPEEPDAGMVVSEVTYDSGSYQIHQTFDTEVTNACRAGDGTVHPDAFEATNTVEVVPEDYEVREGRAVVTRMRAVKRTEFLPKDEFATAGGTCERKSAEWEATVVPLDGLPLDGQG